MGAAQHIQPYRHLTFPVDGHQLAFQSGKGAFDDPHLFAGGEGEGAHFDSFFGVVEHEAETFHLLVGDDGGSTFAAQHHVAADGREGQHFGTFGGIDVYEDHHRDDHALYLFAPVAPLMDFFLHGQETFDAHCRQAVTGFLFVIETDVGGKPGFHVGWGVWFEKVGGALPDTLRGYLSQLSAWVNRILRLILLQR